MSLIKEIGGPKSNPKKPMKLFYNSHICKVRDIKWQIDQDKIINSLNAAKGSQVVVRAVQKPNEKREIDLDENDLDKALTQIGIDLKERFDMEIVIRKPQPQGMVEHSLLGNQNYEDKNDFNQFQWNGNRGTGSIPSNQLRNCPMFFRENGMNLDLIDLYRGKSVFLILNGPSFSNIDHEALRAPGIVTFGINNGAHLFRPNLWTSVDDPTRFIESIWADPGIMKFVPMAHFQKPIWNSSGEKVSKTIVADFPNVIGFRRNEQFIASQWLNEDTINWGNHGARGGGRSVMLSALKICFLLGFRKVYLLGCDFRMDKEHKYWFPEERSANAVKNNTNTYQSLKGFFTELIPYFKEAKFEVFNCTEGSRLDVFPHVDLKTAIADNMVDLSASTEGMYINRYKDEKKREPVKTDSKKIISSLVSSINLAKVDTKPFFHLTLQDCFTKDYYRALHDHLPDSSAYEYLRHRDAMKDDGSSARLHLILTPEKLKSLPDRVSLFWTGVHSALNSVEVKEALFCAHAPALKERFGDSLDGLKVSPRISLIRDEAGYKIGVHSDIKKKVITTQYYLPVSNNQQHLGTTFYSKTGKGKYQVEKRNEFSKNSGYSFTVNNESFHGVDPVSASDAPRHSLLLVYYIDED